MKNKKLKLSIYLSGIVCLIFALFLFHAHFLIAQEEVILTEFINDNVRCVDSTATIDLSWVATSTFSGNVKYYILRKIEGATDFVEVGAVNSNIENIFYTDNNGVESDKIYIYQIKVDYKGDIFYSNYATTTKKAYCPPILQSTLIETECKPDGPYIYLEWTPVSGDLYTYEIYRRNSSEEEYPILPYAVTTEIYYEDGPDIIGTETYFYYIKSVWQDGASAHYDPEYGEPILACSPTLETISTSCLMDTAPGGPVINLSWNKLLGIKEYQVWRKTPDDAEFQLLDNGTITDAEITNFEDKLVESYPNGYYNTGAISYKIKAVWETTFKDSNIQEIDIPKCQPFLSITSDCNAFSMKLRWTVTQGTISYEIYRDGTKIDRNDGTTNTSYDDGLNLDICPGEQCSFNYYVKAIVSVTDLIDSNTVTGSIDCATINPPEPAPVLDEPTSLCDLGNFKMYLSWSPSNNVIHYTLYRDSIAGLSEYITGDTAYTDSGVESSYDYIYSVAAFGENETSISDGAEYTVTAKDCSIPSVPALGLTPNCNEGNPLINLSWTETGDTTMSYVIYRGLSDSALESIMTFTEGTEIFIARSWDDASVGTSTVYYYKVVAKGQDGTDINGNPIQSESIIGSATSYSCDPTTPDLTLGNSCDGNQAKINLSWATDEANTTRYEIFRKDYNEITPIHTINDTSIKTWTDLVSSETAYEYKVEAVGYSSSQRTTQGYKLITSYNCAPPGDFTLTDTFYCQNSYPKVDLLWTDSSNADSYDITRFNNTTAEETIFSDKTSIYTDSGQGWALNFDGSNDYVRIPSDGSIEPARLSVEAWIYPTDFNYYAMIVSKWRNWPYQYYLRMYSTTGRIYTRVMTNSGEKYCITPSDVVSKNKWNLVAFTYDGFKEVIYVNGVEVHHCDHFSGTAVDLRANSNNALFIGRYESNAYRFEGMIDEVRIYGRALTGVEAQEHYDGVYSDESELGGLWHFDEGEGQAVSDSSIYGNNGRLGSAIGVDAYDPAWVKNGLQTGENYNWQATASGVGGETDSNLTAPITINCQPVKAGLFLETACDGIENPIINLSWSYSYSADSFEIYRQGAINPIEIFTSSDTEFALREWTDNTGLTGETSYIYWVKSVNSAGEIESEQALITTLSCAEPSQLTGLQANFSCVGTGNSYPQISLTWDESTNTDYYTVYRNSSPVGYPTTNAFTDSYSNGIRVNTDYQYYITSISIGGIIGSASDVITVPTTGYCTPSTLSITSLTTVCASGAPVNTIIWSDSTDFNTDHYDIYRNGTTVDDLAGTVLKGTLKYVDNDLTLASLNNYTYYIKAIGPNGLESPGLASESINTYSCEIQPSTPVLNLEAGSPYCQGNVSYADLSWIGVDNAYSYNLYRINSDNSISTSSTAVSIFTDKGDHALNFDGSNDYINCGNDVSLQIIGDQTYEFWIKPDNFSRRRNPINKAYGGEGTITFETNGRFTYYWGTAGKNSSPYQSHSSVAVISAGAWTHVAHVRDITNGVMTWYFNGEPVGAQVTPSYAAAKASANNLWIGDGYVYPIYGQMDEVRIYGRALSSTEIQEHYNNIYKNEADLRGVWHFNEGGGSTVYDDSGNSNNGSLINMAEESWKYPDSKPYFINPLQIDQIYKYKIKAIGVDTESEFSNEIEITTGDCFVKTTLGINDICTDRNNPITLLNWDYYTDITDYEIYKDSSPFQQKIPANYISSSGFIKHWLLVGPFTYSDAATAFNTDYIDELDVRPRAGETVYGKTWFDYFSGSSYINFNNIFSPNNYVISYAFAYIYSSVEQDVKLWIGSDDGVKAFLNGDQVHSNYVWRGASPDQDKIDITLSAGINTLLIKVQEGSSGWGFYARIVDTFGNNMLDHITTWDSSAETAVSADYYVKAKIINEEKDSDIQTANPLNCAPVINNFILTPNCVEGKTIIKLEWDEDPNTEYLSIYKRRQLDPPVSWVNIINIASPAYYTDENLESGVIYEYYLTAFGKEEQINSYIESERALICDPYPSKPIIDVEPLCLGDDPRMRIEWNDTINTIAYNIWRQNITAGDIEYTKIEADLPFDTFIYYDKGEIYPLIANNEYKYMVEAIGAGISNSNYSDETDEGKMVIDCANIPPLIPILEIISTDAIGSLAYVNMGWIDSGNEKSYIILRDGIEIATLIQDVDYNLEDSIIYYVDNTVSDNTAYVYRIDAVNDIGVTSSNEETAITPIARPGEFTLDATWDGDDKNVALIWIEAVTTVSGGTVNYKVIRSDSISFDSFDEICFTELLECEDSNPDITKRFYRAEANNLSGRPTYSDYFDAIKIILPTWKEVKP